jgi:putative endonuclease
MSTNGETGRIGEDVAALFLSQRGWSILDRNVRYARAGELDIVASRGDVLAFIEVKTRRSLAYGIPAEAVTFAKRRRIRGLASRYLAERRPRAASVRFDVVEVEPDARGTFLIRHVEDAF